MENTCVKTRANRSELNPSTFQASRLGTLHAETIACLADRLISITPLTTAIEKELRVVPISAGAPTSADVPDFNGSEFGVETLLDRISEQLGTPKVKFHSQVPPNLTSFEQAASTRLAITPEIARSTRVSAEAISEINQLVDDIAKGGFASRFQVHDIVSFDGTVLRAYRGGTQDGSAVVLVLPCGMPVGLCERWLQYLAASHFVVTWESRGLFGDATDFNSVGHDVPSQGRDLFAVMDHFNVASAHVMAICDAAPIALYSASVQTGRITSLSLWHGDFSGLSHCPKTRQQKDLAALMSTVANNRSSAKSVQSYFTQPSVLANVPQDIAYQALYPYTTAELLYRYAKLMSNIASFDLQSVLDKVPQPTLVVTSREDMMVHVEGSYRVAKQLPHGQLHEEQGDHLSLFQPSVRMTELLNEFLDSGRVEITQDAKFTQAQEETRRESREVSSGIEARLQGLWSDVLEKEQVGLKDTFAALGGSSLALVRLAVQIESHFGCMLPLNVLSDQHTVESMVALITQQREPQPSDAEPLFALNDGVLLAQLLGDVCSIYHTDLSKEEALQLKTIERVGASVVDRIRAIRSNGPYRICGHSASAIVAFEAARQLTAQGATVSNVILLDPILVYVRGGRLGRLGRVGYHFFARARYHLGRLRKIRITQVMNYIVGKLGKFTRSATPRAREALVSYEILAEAIKEFRPQPYAGRITLIMCEKRAGDVYQFACWRDLACGRLDSYTIPGGHYSMFEPPNVLTLEATLRMVLSPSDTCPDKAKDFASGATESCGSHGLSEKRYHSSVGCVTAPRKNPLVK